MSSKRKPSSAPIAAPVVKQSAKIPTKSTIDEKRASVAIGGSQKPELVVDDDSSDSNPNSNLEEENQSEDESTEESAQPKLLKTTEDGDVEMEQAEGEDADDSPSFGDLIRGNSTIDVTAALAASGSSKTVSGTKNGEAPVTAISMGITLEQALKTDDNELLESVLQLNNVEMIQNTINRMDSALAGNLLSKLATRMHRRPGRAYSLMNWVQWTLIAHGGALVGQPGVVKKLQELNQVLEERARGLQPLLALKGKLDMLDSQIRFRRAVKAQKSKVNSRSDGEDEGGNPDDAGVIFVEEEDGIRTITGKALADNEDDDDDDNDGFAAANGVDDDSEEGDEDFSDDDDIEEEEEEEEMDQDEVDHDDVEESGEEESDNDDSGPPTKKRK